MSNEPTEGPWELSPSGLLIFTRDHKLIGSAQDAADARLIQQAPAMYDLLQAFDEDGKALLLSEHFASLGGLNFLDRIHRIVAAVRGTGAVMTTEVHDAAAATPDEPESPEEPEEPEAPDEDDCWPDGTPRVSPHRLTRHERLQGLADSGCDTWEEFRGEK
jgi:hypothetical protein